MRSIERRDSKALLKIVADDIIVDFDGTKGPKQFARVWRLDGPSTTRSPVWRELAAVMRLGCARIDSVRVMPSLVGQLSDDEAFEKFVALPQAKLRRSPNDKAGVLATLNFHILTFREGGTERWIAVALSDGRRGYVLRDQVRAALQYRAQFEKIGNRWRMTSFVEGD